MNGEFFLYTALLALHLFLCHAIARAAKRKNRSYAQFWVLSFFFSEIVGFIIVASLAPVDQPDSLARSNAFTNDRPAPTRLTSTRLCPFCAEQVSAAAILCKHCKSDLIPTVSNERVSVASASGEAREWVDRRQLPKDKFAREDNHGLACNALNQRQLALWVSKGEPPIHPWIQSGKPQFEEWLATQPNNYWT